MRHSILSRPLRKASHANVENLDAEFDREQMTLQMKREKYQQTEDFLRRSRGVEASEAERRATAEEARRVQEAQLAAKREQQESLRRAERQTMAVRESLDQQAANADLERRRAKLEEGRRVMEENRRLAEMRKSREQDAIHRAHAKEVFDLAMSESSSRRHYR